MDQCVMCGSYAVNPNIHGRKKSIDLDLCDVCYWRKRADKNFAVEYEQEREKIEKWKNN